jgi:hypothetical protein
MSLDGLECGCGPARDSDTRGLHATKELRLVTLPDRQLIDPCSRRQACTDTKPDRLTKS